MVCRIGDPSDVHTLLRVRAEHATCICVMDTPDEAQPLPDQRKTLGQDGRREGERVPNSSDAEVVLRIRTGT